MKRIMLGCAGLSAVVALLLQQLWLAAALTGAGVVAVLALIPVVAEMRRGWVAASDFLREVSEPGPASPPPLPRLEHVPAPRAGQESRPPWDTAPVPVIPGQGDEIDGAGRHRRERGLRESLAGAIRAAARVPLP